MTNVADPTHNPDVFSGFGPETTDWEGIHQADGARTLLDSRNDDAGQPPAPMQSLAPDTTSPAGEPPDYVAPIDGARKAALEPRDPGPSPGQPIPEGTGIVIHHVWETIERAGESAIIHKILAIGQQPVLILGKNEQRSKAKIGNSGSETVSLGMSDSVTAGGPNAWDLASTDSPLEINHRDWMWAVCATGVGSLQIIETVSELSPTQLGTIKKTQ